MIDIRAVAEAFSGHRFAETYAHLAPDVRWVLVGATDIDGRDAVIEVCEQTLADLAASDTEFLRFKVIAGSDAVAVDAVGRYTGPGGDTSVVSSCDLYDFTGGQLVEITSYTVELAEPETAR